MTFRRTVFLGVFGWASAITLLHADLNWHSFDAKPEGGARRKFRVGFLPVT